MQQISRHGGVVCRRVVDSTRTSGIMESFSCPNDKTNEFPNIKSKESWRLH